MRLREKEIRDAITSYARGTLAVFGFDPELVYAAERFGVTDAGNIDIIKTDVAGVIIEEDIEAKGAFIYPVDYGRLAGIPGQSETGQAFRFVTHEIAIYVPYDDERTESESSFNFFHRCIDYLVETFDLSLDLGLDGVITTSLYVTVAPTYVPLEDDSLYHAVKFRIESRYPVVIGYCNVG